MAGFSLQVEQISVKSTYFSSQRTRWHIRSDFLHERLAAVCGRERARTACGASTRSTSLLSTYSEDSPFSPSSMLLLLLQQLPLERVPPVCLLIVLHLLLQQLLVGRSSWNNMHHRAACLPIRLHHPSLPALIHAVRAISIHIWRKKSFLEYLDLILVTKSECCCTTEQNLNVQTTLYHL